MKKTGLIFIITIAYLLIFGEIVTGLFHISMKSGNVTLLWLLVQDLPLFLIMFVIYRWSKIKILWEHYPVLKSVGLLWYALYMLVLSLPLNLLMRHEKISVWFTIGAALVAVVVGCVEEFIFRGLILGAIIEKTHSLFIGIAVSAVLFGISHSVNLAHQTVTATGIQMVYATALGVFLAVLYLKSHLLLIPIIMHGAIDFTSLLVSQGSANSTTTVQQAIVLVVIIGITSGLFIVTGKKQIGSFKEKFLNKSVE